MRKEPLLPARPAQVPLPHRALHPPLEARRRRRRWFHPARGWFRKVERWASHELSRRLYPHIPLIHLPYERILRRQLSVSEGDVAIRGLAAPLDGLRILLVTDVHTGPFLSRRALEGVVARLASLDFDVLLYGGDIATSRVSDFASCAGAFASLRAPLGTFGVLGNHDHFTEDPPRLAREIEAAGIPLLQNRCVTLGRGGASMTLAGIDDLIFGKPDLDAALRDAPPGTPVVLLSHNPDVFFEAAKRGVSLVLSGHTHAGQIRIPGLPVLVRMSRYYLDEGWYRSGSTDLIVSRGLGAVALPIRIACAPEVVLLRLRAAAADGA